MVQSREELEKRKAELIAERAELNRSDYVSERVVGSTGAEKQRLEASARKFQVSRTEQINANLERVNLSLSAYQRAESSGRSVGEERKFLKKAEAREERIAYEREKKELEQAERVSSRGGQTTERQRTLLARKRYRTKAAESSRVYAAGQAPRTQIVEERTRVTSAPTSKKPMPEPSEYIPAGTVLPSGRVVEKDIFLSAGFAEKLKGSKPVDVYEEEGKITLGAPYSEKYGKKEPEKELYTPETLPRATVTGEEISPWKIRLGETKDAFVKGFTFSEGALDYDPTNIAKQPAGVVGAMAGIATIGRGKEILQGIKWGTQAIQGTKVVQTVVASPAGQVLSKTGLGWLAKGVTRSYVVTKGVSEYATERAYQSYDLGTKGVTREEFKQSISTGIGTAEKEAQEKGGALSFASGLTLFATKRSTFEESVSQTEGTPASLVPAAREARVGVGVGELGGMLAAGATSEQAGRSFTSSWINTLKTQAPKLLQPTRSMAFLRASSTYAFPIMKAGVIEGQSSYITEITARRKPFNVKDAIIYGGIGGLSAGIVGGAIGGTAGTATGVSKSINLAANIIDPFEKPGDILAGPATGSLPVTTVTPTGIAIDTQEPTTTKQFIAPKTSKKTIFSSNIPTKTYVPTVVRTTVPSVQPPTPVPSPVPTPVPSPVPTPTITPTPVPSSTPVPSPIPSIIPPITPTPTPTPTTSTIPSIIPSTIPTSVPSVVPTPVTFPRLPFFPFGPTAGRLSRKRPKGPVFGTTKKQYVPSLYARFFGITAAAAPAGPFTGFEVRPVIVPNMFQKKKKRKKSRKRRK